MNRIMPGGAIIAGIQRSHCRKRREDACALRRLSRNEPGRV